MQFWIKQLFCTLVNHKRGKIYQLLTDLINPLTAVTAIWRFDAITHAAIHQTRPDKFLTRFNTQCAYSETWMPIGAQLLG